ncbi:TPA: hypothetical protein OOF36_000320 [Morganella morganii]|nr:hypothetical protein [Morganella morganii]
MSVMNKPDYKIFAQDAKSGEYVAFPDILRGWGITLEQYNGFPPMELFNSAAKRIDEWLMYLTQRGLPEWDAAVDYPKDAMIQHAGVYYVSLKTNKGEQPNNSQASWKKLTEFLGVDGKLAKDQNGADIPNKPKFIENLGLGEAAKSDVVQVAGASKISVISQDGATKAFASSEFFRYLPNEYTVIYSPNKTYRIVVFNDGAFGSYLTDGGTGIVSFDKTGKMTKGEIPASMVSGLSKTLGVSPSAIPSEKAVSDALDKQKPLGMGQSWRDVTFARSAGVAYPNNKNRTIKVNVRTERLTGSGVGGISLECDGLVIASNRVSGAGTQAFVSEPIPAGSDYKITVEGTTIFQWSELTTQ